MKSHISLTKRAGTALLLALALLLPVLPASARAGSEWGPVNLALGKPVAASLSPAGEGYWSTESALRGVEAGLLTDGVNGPGSLTVNREGAGCVGLPAGLPAGSSFTVDLGEPRRITALALCASARPERGVEAPERVTFYVSADGTDWVPAGTAERRDALMRTVEDPNGGTSESLRYELETALEGARYVKAELPAADKRAALSEIEVLGPGDPPARERNLALGLLSDPNRCVYEIVGGGSGFDSTETTHENGERYTVKELENESLPRLTDGVTLNAAPVNFYTGWEPQKWNDMTGPRSKYVEFYRNTARSLTINLGGVKNIRKLDIHFGAAESYGIYLPVEVSWYLSLDGVSYYLAGTLRAEDTPDDPNDSRVTSDEGTLALHHKNYCVDGLDLNARYVRVEFPVDVYLFADELTVTGFDAPSGTAGDLAALPAYAGAMGGVGSFALPSQAGGVRNEFMAYQGWAVSGSSIINTYKTVDEYMAAIAYVDGDGVPTDWLFDDVTVMGHGYTARAKYTSYREGYTRGRYYAGRDDWYQWLCYAFGLDTDGNPYDPKKTGGQAVINLNALEEAAREAQEILHAPDHKVGVKLVVYPAVHVQDNWGELDGRTLDFTVEGAGSKEAALQNRLDAYRWYIETALELWERAGFEHLELTGFYYYDETIRESTDPIALETVQGLTELVHSAPTPSGNTNPSFRAEDGGRLYIYQLPFYQANGCWKWKTYGFDYALMQPNYSFVDFYTVNQLYECGDLCQSFGLGVQMEFGGTGTEDYIRKFRDYLELGCDIGYQQALRSWYMGTSYCWDLAKNAKDCRYLYDAIYDFVQGRPVSFTPDPPAPPEPGQLVNLALGVKPALEDSDAGLRAALGSLTDGVSDSPDWRCNQCSAPYVMLTGPGERTFTLDLGGAYELRSLAAQLYGRPQWGVEPELTQVLFQTSPDGESWTDAAPARAESRSVPDEANPTEEPPELLILTADAGGVTARYVRLTLSIPDGAVAGLGEIQVLGGTDLPAQAPAADPPAEPSPTQPQPPAAPQEPAAPASGTSRLLLPLLAAALLACASAFIILRRKKK